MPITAPPVISDKPEDVMNGSFPPSLPDNPQNLEVLAFNVPERDFLTFTIEGSDFFRVTGATASLLRLVKSPFELPNHVAVFEWKEGTPRALDINSQVAVRDDQRVHISVAAGDSSKGAKPGAFFGTLVVSGQSVSFSVPLNGTLIGIDAESPIGEKYASLGGATFLGEVVGNAQFAPERNGEIQQFANGALWDTGSGVFYLSRAIFAKWESPSVQTTLTASGRTIAHTLAIPQEDTLATAEGGEVLRFQGGVITVPFGLPQSASVILDEIMDVSDFVYMRDQIVINKELNDFLLSKTPVGRTIRLLARQIRHESASLNLPGRNVVIVADEYDNHRNLIDVTASAGAVGAGGSDGSSGHATSTGIGNQPGGPGSPGGSGAAGSAATSVRLICQRILGAFLVANGAAGGDGGAGGNGGPGGPGKKAPKVDIDGTSGGNGGAGGKGAQGGAGGEALTVFINAAEAPRLLVDGGVGGAGGPGGHPGVNGAFSPDDNGKTGPAGAHGAAGAAGTARNLQVGADAFWGSVQAEIGAGAREWAAYRLAIGEYFYRSYNSAIPDRAGFLKLALAEFDAVLRLNPGNAGAFRLQNQILMNQNVLGLPIELDLIPDFNGYINAFEGIGQLLFGEFNQGITELLAATELQALGGLVTLAKDNAAITVGDSQNQLRLATDAQTEADDQVLQAQTRVAQVNRQITAALDEMNDHSISIGGVLGVVGEVGGAVLAVAAAIPSGGTSLAALVPDVIALTESVSENAGPLAESLFGVDSDAEKEITDAYAAVNKTGGEVTNDARVVTNLVGLINKLGDAATPDNSKYVALVQQGVDLLHEQYLAEKRQAQAAHAIEAANVRLDRANALLSAAQALEQAGSKVRQTINAAGLGAIRSAQIHVDTLLSAAFRAERSLEIYALRSEAHSLFLDAGYVHPDVDRDFTEQRLDPDFRQNNSALISAYTASWGLLLQPERMRDDYMDYFQGLQKDIRTLSFKDPAILQTFRDTHGLPFELNFTDLPDDRFEAKVQGVAVALVGASSASGIISCVVSHGGRYEQRTRLRQNVVHLLEAQTHTTEAGTNPLQIAGVNFGSDPLTSPQSLSFWGRGVVGRWDVSIPDSTFKLDKPDLSNLSEIQVWVGYQFKQ